MLRRHRGLVPTQDALWRQVASKLRRQDPPLRTGRERMRALLATSSQVHLDVRYSRRPTRGALLACPVCFAPLKPRQNSTLWGDSVIVGYRCTVCPFWTPIERRVPAQYTFRAAFHPGTLDQPSKDEGGLERNGREADDED